MANECGGRLVLGVTNERPRRVVGSRAYLDPGRTKDGLLQRPRLGTEAEEVMHPGGRVVVFTVPSRPIGVPLSVDGRYLMAQVLPSKSTDQIRRMPHELRAEGLVHKTGLKRGTRWHPRPSPSGDIGARTLKESR